MRLTRGVYYEYLCSLAQSMEKVNAVSGQVECFGLAQMIYFDLSLSRERYVV
jgi:hypothetical protein